MLTRWADVDVEFDNGTGLGVGGSVIDSVGETDRALALGSISADTRVETAAPAGALLGSAAMGTAVGTVCASDGGGCDDGA